jgi:hypothetical protein
MSSEIINVSLDTVRALAVFKQGLHRRPPAADRQTLLDTIHRIGLLQLDTINVVARSHYLVMLSRVGLYDCADLDALLYADRRLFEQWAHAACLIPIEHYPYFHPAIAARRSVDLYGGWAHSHLGEDPQAVLDAILDAIRERGPLASSDFEDPRPTRGTWWDWKPAKAALEILFDQGHLAVSRRTNFQRYYDLTERVVPAELLASDLTLDDWRRWATRQSVAHLGVATAAQASDYYRQKKVPARATIDSLVAAGVLRRVAVEGWAEPAYVDAADLPLLAEIEAGGHRPALTTFLSPFDNLIWDRRRVLDLFGFDYRIETYTPVGGRKYGYYVMPILHRGRLIGRLDPKADRAAGTLIARALYLEPGEEMTGDVVSGVAAALRELAAFHSAERVTVERSEPEGLRQALLEHLPPLPGTML